MSLDKHVMAELRLWVASGYENRESVFRRIIETWPTPTTAGDELGPDSETTSRLREAIEAAFAQLAQDMRSWPAITDCDRLRAAFDVLDQQGIVALENCGSTQQDGRHEAAMMSVVRDEIGGLPNDGYCFFHQQDTWNAVERGGLMLAFGTFREQPTHTNEVGEAVVRACREAGLQPKWNGSAGRRIEIPAFRWQRRIRETSEADLRAFFDSWELEIRAGYTPADQISTVVADRAEGMLSDFADFGPGALARVHAHTERFLAEQRADEARWVDATINDRITAAFEAMRARGVHASECSGLSIQDGWGYAGNTASADCSGVVFFHHEDVIDGVAGRGLRLAFGALGVAAAQNDAATVALGEDVVAMLEEHGIPCSWNRSVRTRIRIAPFEWQRRRWTQAPGYDRAPRTAQKPRSLSSGVLGSGRPELALGDADTAAAARRLAVVVRALVDEGGFDLRRTARIRASWEQLGNRGDVHVGHLGIPHVFVPAGEHTTMMPRLADDNLRDEKDEIFARGQRARLAQLGSRRDDSGDGSPRT